MTTRLTRDEIIAGLKTCNRSEQGRLADRLQNSPVRLLRSSGGYEDNFTILTARSAGEAMEHDPSIVRIEYRFNQEWLVAYALPQCDLPSLPKKIAQIAKKLAMLAARRIHIAYDRRGPMSSVTDIAREVLGEIGMTISESAFMDGDDARTIKNTAAWVHRNAAELPA